MDVDPAVQSSNEKGKSPSLINLIEISKTTKW
jgi:hypothetical protein